jgi:hypothetical protein
MVDMIRKGRDRKAVGERASRTKLTTAQVKAIRQERGSSRAVGKKFGVSHTAVVLIRNGSTWSHV